MLAQPFSVPALPSLVELAGSESTDDVAQSSLPSITGPLANESKNGGLGKQTLDLLQLWTRAGGEEFGGKGTKQQVSESKTGGVRSESGEDWTELHVAVALGNVGFVAQLLTSGLAKYDVDAFTRAAVPTPLWLAAAADPPHFRMVSLLCSRGADPLRELPLDWLRPLPMQVALRAPVCSTAQR